jgi:hypothetical protein
MEAVPDPIFASTAGGFDWHAPEFGSEPSGPVPSFAEDLGVGVDFRMMRQLSWRVQVDELKTGLLNYGRYNVRACSGLSVRF